MPIAPLSETADTVTLSRADFERLLDAREDAIDRAALAERDSLVAAIGHERYLEDHTVTFAEAERILAGESKVRVWREKRGMTQRALAAAAGVSVTYLSEIEAGKKPGSVAALSGLARALRLSLEDLAPA